MTENNVDRGINNQNEQMNRQFLLILNFALYFFHFEYFVVKFIPLEKPERYFTCIK